MTQTGLVTVGEAMLRLSPPHGESLRTSPNLNVTIGGAELNVAIAAQRMGLDSSWASRLPRGVLGDRIQDHARGYGVEPIISPADERVGIYFAEVGPEPRGVTVTYDRDHSASRGLSVSDFSSDELLKEKSAVFTSGITIALGLNVREFISRLYSDAHQACKYFEVNFRSKLVSPENMRAWVVELLPTIDVLFASKFDLTDLLGFGPDLETASKYAREEFELQYVVVPDRAGRVGELGLNSVYVFGDSGEVHAECPGFIVDPIGAGDAAAGALIASLEMGLSIEDAALYSVRAAAWTQTHFGDAAQFSRDEIVNFDERRVRR